MVSHKDQIKDLLETFSLMETLISQENVFNIEISPYELSTLMKEFRAEKDTYNQVGNNAMTMFYSPEEKQEFEQFLKSRGVKFNDIGDSTDKKGEIDSPNTQSPVAQRRPNRFGV